jgi:hypothetical protein
MVRGRLGQTERARADFDGAVRWLRDHRNPEQAHWSEDLELFRVEAAQLLAGGQPLLPADAFAPR